MLKIIKRARDREIEFFSSFTAPSPLPLTTYIPFLLFLTNKETKASFFIQAFVEREMEQERERERERDEATERERIVSEN